MQKIIIIIAGVLLAGLWAFPAQGQIPIRAKADSTTLSASTPATTIGLTHLMVTYPVFNSTVDKYRWFMVIDTAQVGGEVPCIRLRYATGIAPGNQSGYHLGADDSLMIPADVDSNQAWIVVEDSFPGQYIGKLVGYALDPPLNQAIWTEITRMDTASSGSTGSIISMQGLLTQ